MYFKIKQKCFWAICICSVVFYSCDISYLTDNEFEDFEWDGSVKAPIGFIDYSVAEIFNDLGAANFTDNSTEEFSFNYKETFTSENNPAFDITIDDVTLEDEFTVQESFGSATPFLPFTFPFSTSITASEQKIEVLDLAQEIDSVLLNGGNVIVRIASNSEPNKRITVNIPSLINKTDNTEYNEVIVINGSGEETVTLNLNDYKLDLTNDGNGSGNTVNTLVANLDVEFTITAGNTVRSTDNLSYSIDVKDVSYDVVFGDFKQETFNVSSSTIDLEEFFNNFSDAEIGFENLQMDIKITNDLGVPIGLDLSDIKGLGSSSATNLTYTGDQSLANTIVIDGVENFEDEAKVTNRTLDNSNSNLEQLLKEKPTSLLLSLSGMSNPVTNSNGNKNFLTSNNSGVSAELNLSFNKVSLTKEVDFEINDIDELNSASIVGTVENKIPVGGEVSLDFKDTSETIVYSKAVSLFTAADINTQGESNGMVSATNFVINLTKAEIENIVTATKIAVKVTLNLPENENKVTLRGTDEMTIRLGIDANASISLKN